MTKLIEAFHNFANAPKRAMRAGVHKPWTPGNSGRLISGQWRLTYVGSQYGTCFTLLFWRLEIWYRSYISGKYAAQCIKVQGMKLFHKIWGFFLQGQNTIMSYSDFSTVILQHEYTWGATEEETLDWVIWFCWTINYWARISVQFSTRFLNINHRLRLSSLWHQTVSKSSSCAKLKVIKTYKTWLRSFAHYAEHKTEMNSQLDATYGFTRRCLMNRRLWELHGDNGDYILTLSQEIGLRPLCPRPAT